CDSHPLPGIFPLNAKCVFIPVVRCFEILVRQSILKYFFHFETGHFHCWRLPLYHLTSSMNAMTSPLVFRSLLTNRPASVPFLKAIKLGIPNTSYSRQRTMNWSRSTSTNVKSG